jgi:HEAT repeat protein
VKDEALQKLVNRSLPANERLDAEMVSRYPRVEHAEDYPALLGVLADTEDDDTVRHEVANLLTRSEYPGLAEALMGVLRAQDEGARFRAFATQHLGGLLDRKGTPLLDATAAAKVTEYLHELLEDRDVEVRREALWALTEQQDTKAQRRALEILRGTGKDAPALHYLAIRVLHKFDRSDLIPEIRPFARSSDEATRIAATVALSLWGDEESRAAFDEGASSPIPRIRKASQQALERLEGFRYAREQRK